MTLSLHMFSRTLSYCTNSLWQWLQVKFTASSQNKCGNKILILDALRNSDLTRF